MNSVDSPLIISADLKSKIVTEEDTKARISNLLIKETKRVGGETITAALQQKRIDEQKKRFPFFLYPPPIFEFLGGLFSTKTSLSL